MYDKEWREPAGTALKNNRFDGSAAGQPVNWPYGVLVRHVEALFNRYAGRGGFADRQEMTPQIIFLVSQVVTGTNGFVISKDMGAWRVDNTMPPNDITITAEVVRVTPSQAIAFGWDPALPYMGFPAPGAIV